MINFDIIPKLSTKKYFRWLFTWFSSKPESKPEVTHIDKNALSNTESMPDISTTTVCAYVYTQKKSLIMMQTI